jgi:hypothetical protein
MALKRVTLRFSAGAAPPRHRGVIALDELVVSPERRTVEPLRDFLLYQV